MGRRTQAIEVTEEQQRILEAFSGSRTLPYSLVQRARLILKAAVGEQNKRIGAEIGMHARHVKRWRVRWYEESARLQSIETGAELELAIREVLSDRPRPGCPPAFSAEQLCRIMALACQKPEEFGYPVSHWTPGDLAREAVNQAIVESISPRTIGRFLKSGAASTAPLPLLAASRAGAGPAGIRRQSRRAE